jgi:hypothetical protein
MEEPGAPERSEWGRDDICIFLPVIFKPSQNRRRKTNARPCGHVSCHRAAAPR